MSRIGKKPVEIPSGIKVELKGLSLDISGPKGSLHLDCNPQIQVKVDTGTGRIVLDNPSPQSRHCRALHGTTRALISNMITGVSRGFEKQLLIYGTGYNVKEQNGKLILMVGYCNPVELPIPKGLKVEIKTPATRGNDVPAVFKLSSPDKQKLGHFAAEIRKARPPEPYQGKGIRYADEIIKRKAGKAFTSGTA